MRVLEGLEPKKVFEYFEDLTQIPRGSGNEAGAAEAFAGKGRVIL